MTLQHWLAFRFSSPVELRGESPPDEFLANLQSITGPPFTLKRTERKKPLRGRFSGADFTVRWPLNQRRAQSPRNLHLRVDAEDGGSVLSGEFRLSMGFRVVVMTWLWCGCFFNAEQLIVPGLFYHVPWHQLRSNALFFVIGPLMAYGYTWGVIWIGRRREKGLLTLLGVILRGSAASDVVKELMSV